MEKPTGTATDASRPRLLYLALALSAVLHVALLTALVAGGQPDTPASTGTTQLEIALQAAAPSPASLDHPPSTEPETGPPSLEPLPVPEPTPLTETSPARTPLPLETLPVPEPASQPTTALANTRMAVPEPQPDFSPAPLPTPERDMTATVHEALSQRVEMWLQNPRKISQQESSWEHEGHSYHVKVQTRADSPTRPEQMILTIHTRRDGRPVSTSVTLRRQAFSRFAKFVDQWDDDVWLAGDEVIGRFHSNSRIRVETSRRLQPVFHGPVTVAANMYLGHRMRDPEIFRSGIETGVETVPMPQVSVDIAAIEAAAAGADQHARFFDTDTEIEFLAEAGYRWQSGDGTSGTQPGHPVMYLIARQGVTLSVQGTVAHQVLVYAPRTLRITGSLIYRHPPDLNAASRDLLGLVSDGSVIVAGPGVTGRGDLDIHAAIYAGRRFSVQRFRSRQNDRMTILGSLTAGSVSATEPRFSTRIIHDDRFAVLRPPLFPQTEAWTHEPMTPRWTVDTLQ
ncbi:MAG: hypothetical protein WEB57_07185 [Pseudohongiellaceae bacterium]